MSRHAIKSVPTSREQRRRFLRLFGAAAAALPITVLTGCSDEPAPAPAADKAAAPPQPPPQQSQSPSADSSAQQATAEVAEQVSDASAEDTIAQAAQPAGNGAPAATELQQLSLDDPSAQALGYQHNAADVDLQKYPQRAKDQAANHYCSNCALFQGADGDEWGPCALFPGKLVNANGWCSGYAPRQA